MIFICASVYLSVCLSVHLYGCLFFVTHCPSINHPSVCLYVCFSVSLPVCLFVCQPASVYLSICLSVLFCLFLCLSVHLSVCFSVHLSISFCFSLSVCMFVAYTQTQISTSILLHSYNSSFFPSLFLSIILSNSYFYSFYLKCQFQLALYTRTFLPTSLGNIVNL